MKSRLVRLLITAALCVSAGAAARATTWDGMTVQVQPGQAGAIYPMRYGILPNTGNQDMVPTYSDLTIGPALMPVCTKMGSNLRCVYALGNLGGTVGFRATVRAWDCNNNLLWYYQSNIFDYSQQQYVDLPAMPANVGRVRTLNGVEFYTWQGGQWVADPYMPQSFLENFYVVYNDPIAPMAPPWETLLQLSCPWGYPAAAPNDLATNVCFSQYFSQTMAYDVDNGDPHWLVPGSPSTFRLRPFLLAAGGGYQEANCVDVSDLFMIAVASLGLDYSVQQLYPRPGAGTPPDTYWTCQPFCPIGSDPTWDWTYLTGVPWIMHQIAAPTALIEDPRRLVCDATVALRYTRPGASTGTPQQTGRCLHTGRPWVGSVCRPGAWWPTLFRCPAAHNGAYTTAAM